MRTLTGSIVAALVLCFTAPAVAQNGWDYLGIPDLDARQKGKMDQLWMAQMRVILPLEAQLDKLVVDISVAISAETVNQSALDALVDDLGRAQGKAVKSRLKFLADVKQLLKPAQKKWMNIFLLNSPTDEWMLPKGGGDDARGGGLDGGQGGFAPENGGPMGPGVEGRGTGDRGTRNPGNQGYGCGDRPDERGKDKKKKKKK